MEEDKRGHFFKLPLDAIQEPVDAEPRTTCSEKEIENVLKDLEIAVNEMSYIPQTATADNPALSDAYIFDTSDQNLVLKDLKIENFVGKIKDLSKGAAKRKKSGFPDEYLYVFKYACRLFKKASNDSFTNTENVLIYIKINSRVIPYKKVFIISFHKNKPKSN